MDPNKIIETATAELKAEQFREAVEQEKARIRAYIPWHRRLFPWKIKIERY